jgi:hypothetical protein
MKLDNGRCYCSPSSTAAPHVVPPSRAMNDKLGRGSLSPGAEARRRLASGTCVLKARERIHPENEIILREE